jgi:hypothetical protein
MQDKMMKDFAKAVLTEEQLTWKALTKQKKPVANSSGGHVKITASTVNTSGQQEQVKDICLKYLRHALGVTNAQTGVVPDTCGKVDCERLHNEAFRRKTKTQVIAVVQAAKAEKSLVDAILADSRFK